MNPTSKLLKQYIYTKEWLNEKLLGHRKEVARNKWSDDFYLVSYRKSGNTWVRFLIANVMKHINHIKEPVNFETINMFIPPISRHGVWVPKVSLFPQFPRVFKSHANYRKEYPNVIYILRDPRDTMVSFFHYINQGKIVQYDSFSEFIRSPRFGIKSWLKHISSWDGHTNLIVKYEDLKNHPIKTLSLIMKEMGVEVTPEQLKKAVRNSSFKNMKKIESYHGKGEGSKNPNLKFMREGTSGQWQEYFTPTDLKYFNKQLKKFGLVPSNLENHYELKSEVIKYVW